MSSNIVMEKHYVFFWTDTLLSTATQRFFPLAREHYLYESLSFAHEFRFPEFCVLFNFIWTVSWHGGSLTSQHLRTFLGYAELYVANSASHVRIKSFVFSFIFRIFSSWTRSTCRVGDLLRENIRFCSVICFSLRSNGYRSSPWYVPVSL